MVLKQGFQCGLRVLFELLRVLEFRYSEYRIQELFECNVFDHIGCHIAFIGYDDTYMVLVEFFPAYGSWLQDLSITD